MSWKICYIKDGPQKKNRDKKRRGDVKKSIYLCEKKFAQCPNFSHTFLLENKFFYSLFFLIYSLLVNISRICGYVSAAFLFQLFTIDFACSFDPT